MGLDGHYGHAVPEELRKAFHRELEGIDRKVIGLFALVAECVAGATDALLVGDREAAQALVARDQMIDDTHRDIEELVLHQLSVQAPMAGDLRFLLTVLRIVPELERSADLAEHIGQRAARGLTPELTARTRGLVGEMGRISVDMWHRAADAYAARDGNAYEHLNDQDNELDDLHSSHTAEISSGGLSIPTSTALARPA